MKVKKKVKVRQKSMTKSLRKKKWSAGYMMQERKVVLMFGWMMVKVINEVKIYYE